MNDRTFARGELLRNLILSLEPPSLPPSRAGGGWVGWLSNKPRGRPRGLRCLPFIPTQSPSRVNRGRSWDEWMRRRGRWLKKCSSEYPDQGGRQIAPSKPVTALAGLERWRGFCAVDQWCRLGGEINAVAACQISRRCPSRNGNTRLLRCAIGLTPGKTLFLL